MGELVPDMPDLPDVQNLPDSKSPAVARRDMRVSDDDRKAVVDELRVHFGVGRLDLAEFEDRTNAALLARVRGELDPLLDDLPYLRQPSSGPPIRDRDRRPGVAFRIHMRIWLVLSAFFVVIWAGTSIVAETSIPFWPVFPIAGIGLTVGLHAALKAGFDD